MINGELKFYFGELIKPLGIADVHMSYRKQSKTLPIIATKQHGPTLLGCNWLSELKLHWNNLLSLQHISYDYELEQWLCKYKEVFAEGLRELKNSIVNILVEPETLHMGCTIGT